MAYISVPGGIALCFDFDTAGQRWQFCVMLRASTNPPTSQDLTNATNAAQGWWGSKLQDLISLNTSLLNIRATDLSVENGPAHVIDINEYGDATGTAAPNNVALAVSFRTGLRGRSYRGRCYLSGHSNSNINSQTTFSTQYVGNVVAAFDELRGTMDSYNLTHVVVSRYHNGVARSTAVTTDVTNVICDVYIDSQRRRLAGRGT